MNIFCVLQLDFTIVNNYHIAGYFGWKNISQFLVEKNTKKHENNSCFYNFTIMNKYLFIPL